MCRKVSIEKSLTTYEKAELEDFADELQINADVHLIKNKSRGNKLGTVRTIYFYTC